jgi:amino acid transporter
VLGSRGAMRWLGALTILKFVPLLALIVVGVPKIHAAPGWPVAGAPHALGAAILLVIYIFTGFESGLVAAGEARDPRRDMPRALMAALLVCGLMYALVQAVSIAAVPALAAAQRPLVEVAGVLMGRWGAIVLTAGVIVSVGGHLVSSMFAVPRMTYRLAIDGQLPSWFGTVHPIFRTPVWSIVFFGAISFALAATGGFVWLAGLSVVTRIPAYLCCVAAVPRLKRHYGGAPTALRLPGGNIVPLLAAAVCIGLLTQVSAASYAGAAAFLAAGGVLFIASRRSSRQRALSARRE